MKRTLTIWGLGAEIFTLHIDWSGGTDHSPRQFMVSVSGTSAEPGKLADYFPASDANTLHDNFNLFDKYPHYIFNFSGANRYGMFKEYYPADYARMKQYIAQGRWFPAGSPRRPGGGNRRARSVAADPEFRSL